MRIRCMLDFIEDLTRNKIRSQSIHRNSSMESELFYDIQNCRSH